MSAEIVTEMAQEFDIDSLLTEEKSTLKGKNYCGLLNYMYLYRYGSICACISSICYGYLILGLKQVSSTDIVLETTGPTQGFLENGNTTDEHHDEEMSSSEDGKESEEEMEEDVDEEVLFHL